MIILKFGGTSVGSPDAIRRIMAIVKDEYTAHPLTVVVSAFSGVTDLLISAAQQAAAGNAQYRDTLAHIEDRHKKAARELWPPELFTKNEKAIDNALAHLRSLCHGAYLLKELSPKALDCIMSFGERLSAYIIAHALNAAGVPAAPLDARKIIQTDETFGSARVDMAASHTAIQGYFEKHPGLHIVTGFIGATENGDTTTLGRGGSDYTASILGAALKAEKIIIWTDVDGVMSADPRRVKEAVPIAIMNYEEAMEMSHFGAKVIHPPTMQPAKDADIPIVIKNTFNPPAPGTIIHSEKNTSEVNHRRAVTGIASISHINLLRVQGSGMVGVAGVAQRLFGAMARAAINVILITQASSEHTVTFAVLPEHARDAQRAIEEEFALEMQARMVDAVVVETDLAIVALVGERMRNSPGIAGRMFAALGRNGINVAAIAQGSSELNISAVILRADESKALNALHDAFFLSDAKTVNLFLVGTGLIGGTLLRQISAHCKDLQKNNNLRIRLTGIANSKQMHTNADGISFETAPDILRKDGKPNDTSVFMDTIRAMNLPHSVFVDCTASDAVIAHYEQILSANISIVTPNKKANTGKFETYRSLKHAAARANVQYVYETTVGAGLPVVSTLRDLLISGDRIKKIEGVLSGTLSFIFNTYTGESSFADAVREAHQKGYTEPDPRDDLNGLDFARKLLILAREIGLPLELADIQVENLVPEQCRTAPDMETFFTELELAEPLFHARLAHAHAHGKRLCYAGSIENGRASVSLQEVGAEHPFHTLSGSDNMIVFTTDRYQDTPLVVKGPGAGAEVTAAGVFADIVRIGNYQT